jgi:hypothetical protein
MNVPANSGSTASWGKFPPLTHFDGCDRCGFSDDGTQIATAVVRVAKGLINMVFCGHHFNDLEPRLTEAGWTVAEDNRAKLSVKPGASA